MHLKHPKNDKRKLKKNIVYKDETLVIKKRHDNLKTRPNYKGKNKHYDSCSVAYERMSTQLLWKPHKNANFLKTSQFNMEFCYLG